MPLSSGSLSFSTWSSDFAEPSPVTLKRCLNGSSRVGLVYWVYPMSLRPDSPVGRWYHSITLYELCEWLQLIVAEPSGLPNIDDGPWSTWTLSERPAFKEKNTEWRKMVAKNVGLQQTAWIWTYRRAREAAEWSCWCFWSWCLHPPLFLHRLTDWTDVTGSPQGGGDRDLLCSGSFVMDKNTVLILKFASYFCLLVPYLMFVYLRYQCVLSSQSCVFDFCATWQLSAAQQRCWQRRNTRCFHCERSLYFSFFRLLIPAHLKEAASKILTAVHLSGSLCWAFEEISKQCKHFSWILLILDTGVIVVDR